jgi:guanylate kinase
MKHPGLAIILSAPSGTGKTTVCQELRKKYPNLRFSVSHTTREPREGETPDRDYFFISQEEFQRIKNEDGFLEWAEIHGNSYGTARKTVENILEKGQDLILELDVQGVESLRKINFRGLFIFILPPSLRELERRLRDRGTEDEARIVKRLEVGRKEISKYRLYDYIVTNNTVEETVNVLSEIMNAEKHRTERFVSSSSDIQEILNAT